MELYEEWLKDCPVEIIEYYDFGEQFQIIVEVESEETKWTLFYVIGFHMNNLPVNFLSKLMNLPSNKLNTLTQLESNLKSQRINKPMNVYPSHYYSEVLKYYSERNEFFPS